MKRGPRSLILSPSTLNRKNLNSSSEKQDVGLRSNSSPHEVFDKKRKGNKAALPEHTLHCSENTHSIAFDIPYYFE